MGSKPRKMPKWERPEVIKTVGPMPFPNLLPLPDSKPKKKGKKA